MGGVTPIDYVSPLAHVTTAIDAHRIVRDTDLRLLHMVVNLANLSGTERAGLVIAELGIRESLHKWLDSSRTEAARIMSALNSLNQCLERTYACAGRFIIPGDAEWPVSLNDLETMAPAGIWIRGTGDLGALSSRQMAIVGARDATDYGQRIASLIGSRAAELGVSVVSGGAWGIDAAAHRGAIAAGGRTIAVLACGIDVAYPTSHAGLFERISQGGCVISEMPPATQARKHVFLTRNRLIAALATETVVVEAAKRSGALNTVNWATSMGRRVWGVPGPVTAPTSAGVNNGIYEGQIRLARDIDDPFSNLQRLPTVLTGSAQELANLLQHSPLTTEQICARMPTVDVADVLASLSILEIGGLVSRVAGGWMATST
jgi:DNA processing protein